MWNDSRRHKQTTKIIKMRLSFSQLTIAYVELENIMFDTLAETFQQDEL